MKVISISTFLSLMALSAVSANAHYTRTITLSQGEAVPQPTPYQPNYNFYHSNLQTVTVTQTVYTASPTVTVTVSKCTDTQNTTPISTSTPTTTSNPRPTSYYPPEQKEPPKEEPKKDGDYEMICRVNKIRADAKKPPLKYDERLMRAAQEHSREQAGHKQMTHNGFTSDTKGLGDRITKAGYKWMGCAENIAFNQQTIEEVVKSWKESPGHYANIISDNTCFGWGETNKYWTQNFASGQDCTSAKEVNCSGY